jgi:hypothetical protein
VDTAPDNPVTKPPMLDPPPPPPPASPAEADTRIGTAIDHLADVLGRHLHENFGGIERKLDALRPPGPDSAAEARRLADALIKRADEQGEALRDRLARVERKLDALTALIASPQNVHAVEPAPDLDLNPVFDRWGHEVEGGPGESVAAELYPLTATCRCCRQIMLAAPAAAWAHCD